MINRYHSLNRVIRRKQTARESNADDNLNHAETTKVPLGEFVSEEEIEAAIAYSKSNLSIKEKESLGRLGEQIVRSLGGRRKAR